MTEDTTVKIKRKKMNNEEELKNMLCALTRKATFFTPEKCKTPLPPKQMLSSHIGGIPYFEEGALWPCNKKGKPFVFVLQIFQDSGYTLALPHGVKLLQIFINLSEEEHHVIVYQKLNTEKVSLIECPVDNEDCLGYMVLSFKNIDMLPDYWYLNNASPEVLALAEKIHPGKSVYVIEKILKDLGFIKHDEGSYLGGFFGDLSNSSLEYEDRIEKSFFQLYLKSDNEGPYGWKKCDDAMIYASYNEESKEVESELIINYD